MRIVKQGATLPSVEHVKSRRKPKKNINELHEKSLTGLERAALWITDHIGTMGFFLMIFAWTILWMAWNFYAAHYFPSGVIDKPWDFLIWLFISNLIQIHLMPLIMIGQNLQSRHAEMRAEQEFHITEQTELEMETCLHFLEEIQQSLAAIDHRLAALEQHAGLSPAGTHLVEPPTNTDERR